MSRDELRDLLADLLSEHTPEIDLGGCYTGWCDCGEEASRSHWAHAEHQADEVLKTLGALGVL